MSTSSAQPREPHQRAPRRLLAAVIGMIVGLAMIAATVPSASAAPTRTRGRAPTEPPGTSQALPPGATFNPILAELVNMVKGYMENALLTEVLAGLGIGGDHTAERLAAIQRDIKELRDEIKTDFIRQDFERQLELTRPYTSNIDQWMADVKGMSDHQAALTAALTKALDPKASEMDRGAAWVRYWAEKNQYDAFRNAFIKDYGSSEAHKAVYYFNTALSPTTTDGIIAKIRQLIMNDSHITTLTAEHTKSVSKILAYFEVYQVQANMLDTMYDAFLGKDTGKTNAQTMLTFLDQQLKLLPTPIPDGVGIPKKNGATDTHDTLMWVVAGGHLTMDQRYAHNPAKDDAWWVAKNTTDTKKAGFGDWRMPYNQELEDFTADARPTDNVATFLTMKGINTAETFFDSAIWHYEATVSPYLVDGHNQTLTTHWATSFSVRDQRRSVVDWPRLIRNQGYYQSQIDQKFRESRGTLLMVRSTGDVNYM